jgi:hypothetical protein
MPFLLTSIFSTVGSFFTGLFGFKGEQARTVQSALDVLKSVNDVDGQAITAASQALSAILTQGSFLEKNWRPMFMLILMGIVISFWFGYKPPQFDEPMSPMMLQVWDLLKIGLLGYLPCRTIEKIVQQVNIGSILKSLVNKRLS